MVDKRLKLRREGSAIRSRRSAWDEPAAVQHYIYTSIHVDHVWGGHELIITTKLYDLVSRRIPVQGFTKGPCRCGTCAVLCCAERSTVKRLHTEGEKANKERHSNDSKNAEK